MPEPGDVVLVLAANGKVGQAAVQIADDVGRARVRCDTASRGVRPPGLCSANDRRVNADIAAVVRVETGGHGADVVYNSVGSPYFAAANQAMAHGGRQILISTVERPVPFDIFAFYRGRHTFVGIDLLALDACASAAILRELLPGLASGGSGRSRWLRAACYPLERAMDAYRGCRHRSGSGRAGAVTEQRFTERVSRATENRLSGPGAKRLRHFPCGSLCARGVFCVDAYLPAAELHSMAVVITVAQQKGGHRQDHAGCQSCGGLRANPGVSRCSTSIRRSSLARWHALRRARREQAASLDLLRHIGLAPGCRTRSAPARPRRGADRQPAATRHRRQASRCARADLVLVPIQPSLPDALGGRGHAHARRADERRTAHLVFNRRPLRSRLRDDHRG